MHDLVGFTMNSSRVRPASALTGVRLESVGRAMSRCMLSRCVLLVIVGTGCERTDASKSTRAAGSVTPTEIRVSAAASLRDALNAVKPVFEAESGQQLVINLGSSGDLGRQILASDAADVFLSADALDVERVADAKRIVPDSRVELWSNQLVVIEPAPQGGVADSIFREPFTVEQLKAAGIEKLALADPRSVPSGRYAKRWLSDRGLWDAVADRIVPAIDVRAALALVESGAADAGVVYATDAAIRDGVRVVHRVPLAEGPRIVYVGAAIVGRGDPAAARALLDYLASEPAQQAFERFGFLRTRPVTESR